jgi:rod shape-determining protein MreD
VRPINNIIIYLSLLVALLCQLFPWTGQGIILRPDFMLVVLLYWLLRAPHLCNVGTAWFVGLLVDLATSGLLGQYALAFTLTAYIALSYQRRIVLFNQIQLAGYIFGLLVFERITILLIKLLAGHENPGLHYFWPVLTGLLLWKLMTMTFGRITRPKNT